MPLPPAETRRLIRKEALLAASANLVINFGINAWLLRGKGPHLLTVDSITAREHTVMGSAVFLAVILAVIAGSIAFFSFRKKAAALGLAPADRLGRPYLFFGLREVLASALFLFGAVVAAGVLWQRFLGSAEVSTPVAAAIAGLVAGLATYVASSRVSRALLRAD